MSTVVTPLEDKKTANRMTLLVAFGSGTILASFFASGLLKEALSIIAICAILPVILLVGYQILT